MGASTKTEYHCDKCRIKLRTCNNELTIVTSISESAYWQRLHVKIENHHGMHNDGTVDQATLCQPCAIALLADALKRVRKGERATAGSEDSDENGWE